MEFGTVWRLVTHGAAFAAGVLLTPQIKAVARVLATLYAYGH